MTKQKYEIMGMTCSACSSRVEKNVSKLEGIKSTSVNLLTNSMQVEYDETVQNDNTIIKSVKDAGYGASLWHGLLTGDSKSSGKKNIVVESEKEADSTKIRLWISIGFLIPLMYLSMYHMFKTWFGLPIPSFIMELFHGDKNALSNVFTQFLLLIPILVVNKKYFEKGFQTLLKLSPNMDSLIAIGSSAATIYGIFAIYKIGYGLGHGNMTLVSQYSMDIYFESAGTILTLITVGKYLEAKSKGKTSEAITKLMDLSPKTAIIDVHGQELEVPIEQLKVDDIFIVKPGSLIPVDGIVIEGNSSIDESAITGESIPVEKTLGDNVMSASVNRSGYLKCKAVKVGEDTTLSQIIKLVEEASASKAPIAKMADKIAGVFVPTVIGIAVIAVAIWLLVGASFEFAISIGIAILVISCPCALGLATPVAIMVGTGVGAKNGILIKSGEALQLAKEIDTVVLDKTGTITEGKPRVTDVILFSNTLNTEQLIRKAAALEIRSEHPLAEAIVDEANRIGKENQELEFSLDQVMDFHAEFGRGVEGKLTDGHFYFTGNQKYVQNKGIIFHEEQIACINHFAESGKTPLLFGREKELIGVIAVADTIKPSSMAAIQELKAMNIKTIMLTGDNKRTAEAVRKALDIEEVVAEVLPAEKEAKIAELRAQGRKVAMIGDGVNDAPALASADVGIAIGAGTDVAIESADIILMKSDLQDVVTAIKLSKAVIVNIKENLFWAFFYNIIGIPVAAGVFYSWLGWKLNPMIGAAAMSFSSIFVVGNALRLRNFKVKGRKKKEDEKVEEKIEKIINIDGMMCGHCTASVEKVLKSLKDVTDVKVSLEEKNATITMNHKITDELITQKIKEAGYEVTSIK